MPLKQLMHMILVVNQVKELIIKIDVYNFVCDQSLKLINEYYPDWALISDDI